MGLNVKQRKCVWGRRQVRYLGHLVGCGQVIVPQSRCLSFKNYGKPTTKKGLSTFLGAIGFYRKFVSGFAALSSALTPATQNRLTRYARGRHLNRNSEPHTTPRDTLHTAPYDTLHTAPYDTLHTTQHKTLQLQFSLHT